MAANDNRDTLNILGGGARESIVLLSMNGRKYTTIDYPALHTF